MTDGFQFERERAYRGLIELILGGAVDPKDPLSERKLADALEIGRTPMREAMRDLARDGVLEVRPARGTYVRSLSETDVRELYEVRQALEGLAAHTAAGRGATPELRAYGPVFRDTIDRPRYHEAGEIYAAGAEFHVAVFRAAGNRQLLDIYEPLRLRFRLVLALPRFVDHQRVWESVGEHLAILEAIEAGDGADAERRMRDHLARGAEVRARWVAANLKAADRG
jgi:DNA-binding GntR family transcriptional regulator